MLLEDFLVDIEYPLLALRLLIDDTTYKMEEDWGFFRQGLREEANELKAYINALQILTKYLNQLKKRYRIKVEHKYRK